MVNTYPNIDYDGIPHKNDDALNEHHQYFYFSVSAGRWWME